MKPTKQTVYLPVKEHSVFKILESGITLQNCYPEEGYFFTPEQLNNYTQSVIKQTLETAAEKVKVRFTDRTLSKTEISVESITNTFEETFNKLKV